MAEAAVIAAGPERKAAEDAVGALARAMKNVSFYEVTHQVVAGALKEVSTALADTFESESEFVVKFTNGYVVIQDAPLLGQSASIGNLVGACHRRGVDTIVLRPGITEEELSHLVEVLSMDPDELDATGGAVQALAAHGVRRVAIQKLVTRSECTEEEQPRGVSEWSWVYTTALDVLRGAAAEIRTGQAIDIGSVQTSIRDIVDDILGERSIIYSLNWMKGLDEYTFVHALHICVLAIELGRDLGLSRVQLEELGTATLLHDIGKIFVPLEILRKPVKLDPEEFAIMSRHSIDGALVLAREPALPPVAAVVAFEHHIHMDHSGYPHMRHRRPLHMYSLMTSIVDVYDALTTMRPYRAPLPPRTAVRIMVEQLSTRLEPRLLARFLEMLGPYPWGTMLRVRDGRFVVVTRPNSTSPGNPMIRLVDIEGEGGITEGEVPLKEIEPTTSDIEVVDPVVLGINLTMLMHRAAAAAREQSSV